MQTFDKALAFVTGGASGAGFAQAKALGRNGAKVCIADVRADELKRAANELKALEIEIYSLVLDVTDRAAYAAAAEEVEAVFGMAPTIISHTAGVNSFGPIEATTYDDYDWLVGVNLGGVINGMVTFVPRMIASGHPGHIVAVSSMGGFEGSAVAGPYSAAKAAVINLMEGYRKGLQPRGIGVSVCCPANIRSNIAEASRLRPERFGQSGYTENEASVASLHAIHRHGMDPDQLADAILDGIRANDLYIIPYPEVREGLEKHFDAILSAVAPIEYDPDGSRQRSEALAAWAADRQRLFEKHNQT